MFTDLDLKMIIIYIIKSEKVAAIFRAHSSMPHPYPGVRFNRERDKAYALESGVQKARGGAGAGGAAWGW